MRAIMVAVVSGILLLASWQNVANARISGAGVRPAAPSHVGPRYYRTFRRGPLWGSFIAVPAFPPVDYPPYPPLMPDGSNAGYPGEAASGRDCQNPTRRTVSVPAEAGGTKEITITYCHR
jgi:hypothetical protein